MTGRPGLKSLGTSVVMLGLWATTASAQAFVPMRGEGAVTVIFTESLVIDHLLTGGKVLEGGDIRTAGMMLDFSLGLGRGFAASVSVPYIATKWWGPDRLAHVPSAAEQPLHPDFVKLDTGQTHSSWQDLRFDLRYNLSQRGVAITPFVRGTLPMRSYEFLAHSAVGAGVRAAQVGVYVARAPSPRLPRVFVQGRVGQGFEQEVVAGISISRTYLAIEGGYFLTDAFRVFGIATGQITHGGIDVVASPRAELRGERWIHHDQIVNMNQTDVGGGVSLTLKQSFDIFGSVLRTVSGKNTHALSHYVTVGLSYGFGGRRLSPIARASGSSETRVCQEEQVEQLARCVCLKK